MGVPICNICTNDEHNMIKVAITGASGFIGRNIISVLNKEEARVTAITRKKHKDLPTIENGKWIELDINNPPYDMYKMIGGPDIMIHLAWDGLPNYNSIHHIETELPAQYEFLNTLVRQGLKSLVVAGTCFEYGIINGPLSEDLTTNPSNSYGIAKDSLRRQLELLKNEVNFKFTWARLFYLYGEGQSSNSIYSQLKKAVKSSENKFNMSMGEQLRDYLHIKKAAQFLVNITLLNKDIGLVNICSGAPISIRRLVEEWIKNNNWDIELNLGYYPYPDYEPMSFWGDKSYLLKLVKDE